MNHLALLLMAAGTAVISGCMLDTQMSNGSDGRTTTHPNMSTEIVVEMNRVDGRGVGESIGFIRMNDSPNGLVFTPDLKHLPPGAHGFHVHENPDCGAKEKDGNMTAGMAAGEHYDPARSGKHAGPDGMGHHGDLPRLVVAADGNAGTSLTAPHLQLADVRNRSLMIHAESDNYSDHPGGARIACGVVK